MRLKDLRAGIARRVGRVAMRLASKSFYVAGTAILSVGLTFAGPTQAAILLSEDFEGLALQDSPEEDPSAMNVWTDVPPEGWIDDDTLVPGHMEPAGNNGVFDWSGWNFADRDWWVGAAGDQRRSEFVNASGTVMVADPDEWDDDTHPAGPPWYETYISTRPISLAGIDTDTVELEFDSSWRPEFDDNFHQTGNIVVSYDGAAPIEILRWESDAASPFFHTDEPNEHITMQLSNPAGASEMVITFGLFEAGNDWWWAIDNLEIEGLLIPDVNSDGTVDLLDFAVIRDNMGNTGTTFAQGDVNSDGSTTLADFGLWEEFFNEQAAVPEPTTLTLLAIGALFTGCGLLRRRAGR